MLDSCQDEIKDIIRSKGNADTIEDLDLTKEALHTISIKLKKSIRAKEIDSIKTKDFKIIEKHKDKLQILSDNTKLQNIKKKELKNFIKETCNIGEGGKVFKILMTLK